MRRCDAVVVGAGIMGSATAWWLAASGLSTLVVERFHIGHKRGSSHGSSRIFRLSYPLESYVAMAQEALALWRELESHAGRRLLVTTGGLDLGPGTEANLAALRAAGASCQPLDAEELRRRFSFLSIAPERTGLWQPDAGFTRADQAWEVFADLARQRGCELEEGSSADALEPFEDRVVVHIDGERVACRTCVVTAGAWAKDLLATAGITLEVVPTRETVAYFRYDGPVPPSVIEHGDPPIYALAAPGLGLKVGEHRGAIPTDPNDEGTTDADSILRVTKWITELYPGVDGEPVHAETCLYTNTPDESFVLERHGRIVVGSPCSGHGFKFAPLIGKRLAALAQSAL